MIRPAKSVDAFAIVDVIVERHPETPYADVPIDEREARRLMAQSAQRHGGTNEGATFLMVNERADGVVDAFMLGILSRVYHIGTMLAASDVYLLGRRDADPRALVRLFDAYIAWAESNPRVFEIGASWADAISGNEIVTKLYERRGFELCSQTYRRRTSINAPALHILRECVA